MSCPEERSTPTARHKKATAAELTISDPPLSVGGDLSRRALLGLVTALVVARPMIAGEDPGRLLLTTGIADPLLALLWLVAAAGWAAWRLGFWRRNWYAGPVEAALLATVLCVGFSACGAAYAHPAWLIAGEWLAVLMAFFIVRQLTTEPEENRALLAAVLATGVTLSAYAVYQRTVEAPGLRAAYEADPRAFAETHPQPYLPFDMGEAPPLEPAPADVPVSATFASPAGFAGYLVLLLPALLGAAMVDHRARGRSARLLALTLLVLLALVALALTQRWPAFLALGLVGGTMVGCTWSRLDRPLRLWAALGLVGLLAGTVLSLPAAPQDPAAWAAALQLEAWRPTWAVIRDHFWQGVGPGNFASVYPRYLSSARDAPLFDAPSSWLSVWAGAGLLTLAALLVTVVGFFWMVLRGPGTPRGRRASATSEPRVSEASPPSETAPGPVPAEAITEKLDTPVLPGEPETAAPRSPTPPEAGAARAPEPALRWEFYLGGVLGLILAFLLRAWGLPKDSILSEGLSAAGRSLVWFGAFALLESVPWPSTAQARALAAGVAGLLLYLIVTPGLSSPALAQPLWVVAALALNALGPVPVAWTGRHWLAFLVPLPVLTALTAAHATLVFTPVASASAPRFEARKRAWGWHLSAEPELRRTLEQEKDLAKRNDAVARAHTFLERTVIKPLERAVTEDPGDAALQLELAQWYGKLGELYFEVWEPVGVEVRSPNSQDKTLYEALRQQPFNQSVRAVERKNGPGPARIAQQLNPENAEAYALEGRLRMLFAEVWRKSGEHDIQDAQHMSELGALEYAPIIQKLRDASAYRQQRSREEYEQAAVALRKAVARDPTNPRIHYWLADVYRQLQDESNSRQAAQAARDLDRQARDPRRQLTDVQREQVRVWAQ